MTVDRGGLRYTIRVENEFSAGLRKFREDVLLARRAWSGFRRNVTGLGRAANNVGSNIQKIANGISAYNRVVGRTQGRSQRRIDLLNREADALQRINAETGASRRRERTRRRRVQIEGELVRRLSRDYIALARARRVANNVPYLGFGGGRGRGRGGGGSGSPGGNPGAAPGIINDTGNAARKANKEGSRFLFTFRRLFGVLAAFTAARVAAQGIGSLVGQMVSFNRQIEDAQLGIASILTASGSIIDANNNALEGVDALNEAQRISQDQLRKLRVEGLATAATFDQLADTFQVALGPGLEAGLSVDQIRKFTVQVSQAASAAGVAQNQLSEEIRSILSGTIQQRTTRLAAILGITNEDIRQARTAGNLVEFLQDRFEAFTVAGEVSLKTFTAAVSNAQDAVSQILGAGGLEFFNSLKGLLQDVINSAVTFDRELGTLDLNANAVRSVKLIGDALSDAVEEARALLRELTADELEQSALFVASAITGLSSALRSIIRGFTDGINDLAAVFNRILGEIRSVAGAGLVGPDDLATATRLATVFFGLRTTIKAIGPAIGLVTTRVAGLNAGLATTNGLVNSVLLRIGSLAAVLLALPVAAATVSDSIAGLDDDLSASANITLFVKSLRDGLDNLLTDVELFTRGFRLQFEILVIQAGGLWERFWDGFKLLGYQAILGIVVTLRDTLRDTAESLSSLGGPITQTLLGPLTAAFAKVDQAVNNVRQGVLDVEKGNRAAAAATDAQVGALERQLAAYRGLMSNQAQLNQLQQQRDQAQGEEFNNIVAADQAGELLGFQSAVSASFDAIRQAISGQSLDLEIGGIEEAIDDLGRVERAADETATSILDGWREGLSGALDSLPGAVEVTLQIIRDITNRFAALVADVIVDAFDPSNDKSLQERFADFLRGIARQVIQTLVAIATTKIILKALEVAAGGIAGGMVGGDGSVGSGVQEALIGFQRGGKIRTPWDNAKGYAGGGIPNQPAVGVRRPKGLDPRDTVPIWTQPGEWVIRRSSAMMYGNDVLNALNRGLIDPTGLRALAGVRTMNNVRRQRGPGFVTGGEIDSAAGAAIGETQEVAAGASSSGPTPAYIVANDRQMDALLTGGRQSMLRFISDNRNEIRRRL